MIKKIIFAVSVVFVAFACAEDTLVEKSTYSNLVIKTGTICGWCAVNDTLIITGNSVRYVNYAGCSTRGPVTEKTGQLITTELDGLISKLNVAELNKLDLNSCNVCVDGCDDWIYYKNGTESHYIRFTRNDPNLQPLKEFVDYLNVIKTRYVESN